MRARVYSRSVMHKLGWELVAQGLGKYQRWAHCGGWSLEHCGHATALTPWILRDAEGALILTGAAGELANPAFGTAWASIAEAVEYVFVASPARPCVSSLDKP